MENSQTQQSRDHDCCRSIEDKLSNFFIEFALFVGTFNKFVAQTTHFQGVVMGDFTNLNTAIASLQAEAASLAQDEAATATALADVQTELTTQDGNIATLTTDVDALITLLQSGADQSEIDSATAAVQAGLSSVQTTHAAVTAATTAAQGAVTSMQAEETATTALDTAAKNA